MEAAAENRGIGIGDASFKMRRGEWGVLEGKEKHFKSQSKKQAQPTQKKKNEWPPLNPKCGAVTHMTSIFTRDLVLVLPFPPLFYIHAAF